MKNRPLNLFSALSILILVAAGQVFAQPTQIDNRPRTASIAGRVTAGGAPVANALVTVMEDDSKYRNAPIGVESQDKVFVKVRTDDDGRYRVAGLAPGAYFINALSKAYVAAKNSTVTDSGKSVTLDDGESREDIDIALIRGGVITGRVVDAEGRPLIESGMQLLPVAEDGKATGGLFHPGDWMMMRTDDRGVYRIYGVPAGRYLIGVEGMTAFRNRKYPQTFYPDAANRNEAKIIEIKEGSEVIGIDIRFGAGEDTYEATGRVIDSETGQPLPQVMVMCRSAPDDSGAHYGTGGTTDDEGNFRIKGLLSGQYDLYLENMRSSYLLSSVAISNEEHYSEKTRFSLNGADVSGLEVRAIRGSTLSGIVVIAGSNDPAIKAKLQQTSVAIQIVSQMVADGSRRGFESRSHTGARVAMDGSFQLSGLAPGIASFEVRGLQENIFSIKRIERGGAEVGSNFEIGRGEQITGVRIVVAHNIGTIRGQVEISGGKLPEDRLLNISASPIGATRIDGAYPAFQPPYGGVTADDKGRFVIENLPSGEYELRLNAMVKKGPDQWMSATETEAIKQRVTVSGGETTVKFTLDLERKQQENRQ
jgi:hypothetical protein